MRIRCGAIALALVVLVAQAGEAATLATKPQGGLVVLEVSGSIESGDAEAFRTALDNLEPRNTVVALDSGGGRVAAALAIGRLVRARGLRTAVLGGRVCASACGLIWLGGVERYVGATAQIGFHSAYVGSGEDAREARLGNAAIGDYLRQLGLPPAAIEFVTAAPPSGILWLQTMRAQQIGIAVAPLPPELTVAAGAAPPSGEPADASQRAQRIALEYFGLVSQPDADVGRLAELFAATVLSLGQPQPRAAVMARKARFFAQWPRRRYAVRPGSVAAHCEAVCVVTGIIDWAVTSGDGVQRDSGVASFRFDIALAATAAGGRIVAEEVSGIVATATSADTSAAGRGGSEVTASAAYAEGRRARAALERWYAALAPGDYRRGAAYWLAHRTGTPPSCSQAAMSDEWQQGCADGRLRLAPSLRRLQTDAAFGLGWDTASPQQRPQAWE